MCFSLVVLSFLVIQLTYVNASSLDEVKEMENGLKEYLGENYKEQIEKNTSSANSIRIIESMFNKNNTKALADNIVYPNYVGGLYIDDDNEVVIQIVKEKMPSKSKADSDYKLYESILSVDETAKIKYVNYSYNEIKEVIEVLEDYYSNNCEKGNIDSYYDDIVNNRVVVELRNYSKSEINDFKKNITDSPLIYFTKSKNITTYQTTYLPGQVILPLACSMGFRAKLGNAEGFVTAGHCVTGLNQNVSAYGVVKKYRFSGNIDAAMRENTNI